MWPSAAVQAQITDREAPTSISGFVKKFTNCRQVPSFQQLCADIDQLDVQRFRGTYTRICRSPRTGLYCLSATVAPRHQPHAPFTPTRPCAASPRRSPPPAGAVTRAGAGQADSRERTLFVSAVDDKGEPVEGLGPEAFVVREDGRAPRGPARLARHRADRHRPARRQQPGRRATRSPSSATALAEVRRRRWPPATSIAVDRAGRSADDPRRLHERPEAARPTRVGRLFSMPQSGMTLLDAIVETARGLAQARDAARRHRAGRSPTASSSPTATSADVVARARRRASAPLHAVTIGQFYHSEEHGDARALVPARRGPARSRRPAHHAAQPDGPRPRRCSGWRASCRRSTRSSTAGRSRSFRPRRPRSRRPAGVTMRGTPARGRDWSLT